MRSKVLMGVCCATALILTGYRTLAVSTPAPPSTPASSSAASGSSNAGYVSLEHIVKFENVKRLSPALAHATTLLRTGRYQEAQAAYQTIQHTLPTEALAYRGENEASRSLNTLDAAIFRDRQHLSALEAHSGPTSGPARAALNYALGDALMMKNYPIPIGIDPRDLGQEPRRRLLEAIRLNPNLLEAHLALAAYYEHRSQMHGTAARHEYDVALRLRPDLYQIRYLHAASWDRPGYLGNEAQLRARGFQISDDEKSFPERAVAECLNLTRNHPDYSPPYYTLGSDYVLPMYSIHDDVKARHYFSIYAKIGDRTSSWWQYAAAEAQRLNRIAADHK